MAGMSTFIKLAVAINLRNSSKVPRAMNMHHDSTVAMTSNTRKEVLATSTVTASWQLVRSLCVTSSKICVTAHWSLKHMCFSPLIYIVELPANVKLMYRGQIACQTVVPAQDFAIETAVLPEPS